MKVYISVDMEGIAGIVSWKQDEPEHRMITRRLMTGEANAAIEGALAAGATEIVVGDSHNTMINLIPDELRPEARLVSGSGRPLSMVDGVDGALPPRRLSGGLQGVPGHGHAGLQRLVMRPGGGGHGG